MIDLGGLAAEQFLRRYWQKKPLSVAAALPVFENFVDRRQAIALACSQYVESRLVMRKGRRWQVEHGPFRKSDFSKLPPKNWTLLIQGVNLHIAEADRLLRQFSFIPYSRLDDVMVSYAVEGGGVGPHFDSYDVFLLQGMGRRRWRIGNRGGAKLAVNAPLKLLANFAPDREHVLDKGDMLYLPPNFAHDGTALGECVTYSIGFRAPGARELTLEFLAYLQDHLAPAGEYRDPHLQSQREPAAISDSALKEASRLLNGITWNAAAVEDFFGRYLTEPKPQVFFSPPRAPLSRERFEARCRRDGLSLDLKTQMLYRRGVIFVNGERAQGNRACFELANRRCLRAGARLDNKTAELLYSWFRAGYLGFNERIATTAEQRRRT